MFHSFHMRGLNSYKRGIYIGVQTPLAIHTNNSLAPLLTCPHAHTCACVHIHIYSHSPLRLCTFTHIHQHFTLSPSLIILKSTYISYGNTLWHACGTSHCTSIHMPLSSSLFHWNTALRSITSIGACLTGTFPFNHNIAQ